MRILLLFIFLIGLMGCTSQNSTGSVRIRAAVIPAGMSQKSNNPNYFSIPPLGGGHFDCYAINVIGEGIEASGASSNQNTINDIANADKFCSYPGVLSPLIPSSGGRVELIVPRGKRRVFQVLGILSPGGCAIIDPLKNHFNKAPSTVSDPVYPGIYEVGRKVTDTLSSFPLLIQDDYTPATLKEVRCSRVNIDCNDVNNTGLTPTGTGGPTTPFRLCTGAQLQQINSSPSSNFTLENNLDATGFAPVSAFSGVLDGQGYSIYNFNYSSTGAGPIGFVSTLSGTIQNLNLSATVNAPLATKVGGLVGDSTGGVVSGVKALSVLTGLVKVGGMIGNNGSSANVDTSEVVSGSTVAGLGSGSGGFVGANLGNITTSKSVSAVTTTSGGAGGFAGLNSNSISFSSSGGLLQDVSGSAFSMGGFVGANSGIITHSSSSTSVTSSFSNLHVGGFVGLHQSGGTIGNCSATGNVSATLANEVGGFAGNSAGALSMDSATGAVSGVDDVGGFVGINSSNITDCYSTGSVQGATAGSLGGFGGRIGGNVTTSYTTTQSITGAAGDGFGNPLGGTRTNCASRFEYGGVSSVSRLHLSEMASGTVAPMTTANFTTPPWVFDLINPPTLQ